MGDVMGLSAVAWIEIIVPVIVAAIMMILYAYWDKIVHKEYYIDDDILAYDEELVEEHREGEK